MFQLISEKRCSGVSDAGVTAQGASCILLTVENLLVLTRRVTVGQQKITEAEALYVLASRYVELRRSVNKA